MLQKAKKKKNNKKKNKQDFKRQQKRRKNTRGTSGLRGMSLEQRHGGRKYGHIQKGPLDIDLTDKPQKRMVWKDRQMVIT